ncbi:MAG: hypothetical protein ACLQGU_07230 [bacterium]
MNGDEKAVRRKQEQRWKEWVKKKIGFYISTGRWDNVDAAQLNAWLGNFDEAGQKWALTLLNYFIYYPARDVKQLCRYGLTKALFSEQLLGVDRGQDFCCTDDALRQELTDRIRETLLVPLLLDGNPTESGNAIARLYTTLGLVAEPQVIRPDEIHAHIDKKSCKRVLFVDDIMGSGEQLESFWNQPFAWLKVNGEEMSLAQISAQHKDVSFDYLVLLATEPGLRYIEHRVPGLNICFCEKLSEEYRVFGDDSIFFETPEDRQACKSYLEDLCYRKKIHFGGYRGLDFAVAFSHGAPDSCMPLFWEESSNWVPLFQRRM